MSFFRHYFLMGCCPLTAGFCLFNVGMIADVLLTVTMEALATGAIPKFQLRIADIRFSADGTFVGVRCFYRGGSGFI